MESLEKKTLGKYEVLKEIGRGSMGTVYLGHDHFTGHDVAIKIAHPETLNDAKKGHRHRKLFFNEAKASGMLVHPNIIATHDAGIEDDIWYLVMEYVSGGQSLGTYCRPDHLLPLKDVVEIIFACASALDYAHRKGVIHRDIKPRNILLTENQQVKIGDFGLALITRVGEVDTQVHGKLGSPLYMSPEQVRGETVTNHSDIFSIGVVLYELLTGKHPFSADNLRAITCKITREAHAPLREHRADIPPVLEHIIDRTLKKHPAGRYNTGLDLAGDLSLVFDHIRHQEKNLASRDIFNRVKDLSFFQGFAQSQVWEIIHAGIWQDFVPGAEIIREGEVNNSFYILVFGTVIIRKGDMDVDVLPKGSSFGEVGLLAHTSPTPSVLAQSHVSVIEVRSALFERLSLRCQLCVHKAILNNMSKRLSRAMATMANGGG